LRGVNTRETRDAWKKLPLTVWLVIENSKRPSMEKIAADRLAGHRKLKASDWRVVCDEDDEMPSGYWDSSEILGKL